MSETAGGITEELSYVEESASLTEEQWERLIRYYRLTRGQNVAQGLIEARQFQASMRELQRLAGQTQEQIGEVSQAILDMAIAIAPLRNP